MFLKGTSLHAVTEKWKSQAQSDFDELMELELQEGVTTARSALEGYLTKEAYLWALSTVRWLPEKTLVDCCDSLPVLSLLPLLLA